ncbi:type VI secretion system-associated FHA domain protein TagH [Photobacterium kishitanii]|uniref:type VI secretion system-associated FHA domain protein TagH n=1 Tax=Photobacterium kishitanii TaxID=318456 RepID=UPI000D15C318|nr:type VI secretion system-associated FHA domain protein TagH [Photobacterium kishitanii]PSV17131.1 type VI secretion system-associated FHA domain protein TagH [Photobacterium kishitanii]
MAEQKLLKLKITNTQYFEPGLSAIKEFFDVGGTIGSSSSSYWHLTDRKRKLASTHCLISFIDGLFCITDISNQTYINYALMPIGLNKIVRLNENDVISIGPYHIRVSIDDMDSKNDKDIEDMLSDSMHLDLFGEEMDLMVEEYDSVIDDPLFALDKAEKKIAIDTLISGSKNHNFLSDLALLTTEQYRWLGNAKTTQADTEHDITSVMALNRPQSVFNSNDLLPSLSIATASIKDKEMDDKTLVLLEEEMERSFVYSDNQTSMPNDENHLLTGPLFRGLGVRTNNGENLADMQMLTEEIGASLQAAVKGLITLHQQFNSSRYGVMNKSLQPIEDNPLRLGLDYDETIQVMFDSQRSIVHLSAPAAIEESLRTVKDHNDAVHVAICDALNQIIQAFSPEILMRRFLRYRRPGQMIHESPEAWAWEMYQSYHQELTSNRQHGFEKLFWEIFDQSYDKNLREQQQEV